MLLDAIWGLHPSTVLVQDDCLRAEHEGLPAVRAPPQPALLHTLLFRSGMKQFGAAYAGCETNTGIGLGLVTKAFTLLWLPPELRLQAVVWHQTAVKDDSPCTLSRDDVACLITAYRNPLGSVAVRRNSSAVRVVNIFLLSSSF